MASTDATTAASAAAPPAPAPVVEDVAVTDDHGNVVQPLRDLDVSKLELGPMETNKGSGGKPGQGQSAYFNGTAAHRRVRVVRNLRQVYPVGPGTIKLASGVPPEEVDGTLWYPAAYEEYDGLNVAWSLDEEHAAEAAVLQALDQVTLQTAWEKRDEWFSAEFTSTDALRPSHRTIVKQGKAKAEGGGFWDATFKGKIRGWAQFITHVSLKKVDKLDKKGNKKGEEDKIAGIRWAPRLCDGKPLPKGTTVFARYLDTDEVTDERGARVLRKVYTKRWPVFNGDNKPLMQRVRDPKTNAVKEVPVMRWVGPQDAVPNAREDVKLDIVKIWESDGKFGAGMNAPQIFITPPAPRKEDLLEGIAFEENDDAVLARVHSMMGGGAVVMGDFGEDDNAAVVDDVPAALGAAATAAPLTAAASVSAGMVDDAALLAAVGDMGAAVAPTSSAFDDPSLDAAMAVETDALLGGAAGATPASDGDKTDLAGTKRRRGGDDAADATSESKTRKDKKEKKEKKEYRD